MEVFEKGQPKGDRKERRKVQNRQAQRTYRAKLKMRNKEAGSASRLPSNSHNCCLVSTRPGANTCARSLIASPTSRGSTRCSRTHLAELIPLVDRLERENTLLKTGQPSVFRTI